MIFQHTWVKVVEGTKTQTRRIVKPGETLEYYREHYTGGGGMPFVRSAKGRVIYKWRSVYAVQPGRGQLAIWWRAAGRTCAAQIGKPGEGYDHTRLILMLDEPLPALVWRMLRIRITGIHKERLQAITDADALAEGCESVDEYRALWNKVNGKRKGARWNDNPEVWVLTFKVVK